MQTFLMILADGFEEIEALGTLDLLRRAGVSVQTVALGATLAVRGAHGITVETEGLFGALGERLEAFDGVILPGGMGGATALSQDAAVLAWIRRLDAAGKWVTAICAAPALVLTAAGVLGDSGRQATCYPAPDFVRALGADYVGGAAVRCGHVITGAGPGAFGAFAREIAVAVCGEAMVRRVWGEALMEG